MVDATSAEFVAGRVVAVFALERFVRERAAFWVWGSTAIALVLWVGAVASNGFGAVVVALFALMATTVAVTLWAVRNVVVRGVRRVGGGPNYERLRPLVAKRFADVERAHGAIPTDNIGLLKLAWMARRPKQLGEHVRETAQIVVRTIPEAVNDVRRELEQSPTDI